MSNPEVQSSPQLLRNESTASFSEATRELHCIICMDILVDPRRLQCGHPYCLRCLYRLAGGDRSRFVVIRCPLHCEKNTVCNSGVRGLPRDVSLYDKCRVARITRQELGKAPASPTGSPNRGHPPDESNFAGAAVALSTQLCEWCGDDLQGSTMRCHQCSLVVCTTCMTRNNGTDHSYLCLDEKARKPPLKNIPEDDHSSSVESSRIIGGGQDPEVYSFFMTPEMAARKASKYFLNERPAQEIAVVSCSAVLIDCVDIKFSGLQIPQAAPTESHASHGQTPEEAKKSPALSINNKSVSGKEETREETFSLTMMPAETGSLADCLSICGEPFDAEDLSLLQNMLATSEATLCHVKALEETARQWQKYLAIAIISPADVCDAVFIAAQLRVSLIFAVEVLIPVIFQAYFIAGLLEGSASERIILIAKQIPEKVDEFGGLFQKRARRSIECGDACESVALRLVEICDRAQAQISNFISALLLRTEFLHHRIEKESVNINSSDSIGTSARSSADVLKTSQTAEQLDDIMTAMVQHATYFTRRNAVALRSVPQTLAASFDVDDQPKIRGGFAKTEDALTHLVMDFAGVTQQHVKTVLSVLSAAGLGTSSHALWMCGLILDTVLRDVKPGYVGFALDGLLHSHPAAAAASEVAETLSAGNSSQQERESPQREAEEAEGDEEDAEPEESRDASPSEKGFSSSSFHFKDVLADLLPKFIAMQRKHLSPVQNRYEVDYSFQALQVKLLHICASSLGMHTSRIVGCMNIRMPLLMMDNEAVIAIALSVYSTVLSIVPPSQVDESVDVTQTQQSVQRITAQKCCIFNHLKPTYSNNPDLLVANDLDQKKDLNKYSIDQESSFFENLKILRRMFIGANKAHSHVSRYVTFSSASMHLSQMQKDLCSRYNLKKDIAVKSPTSPSAKTVSNNPASLNLPVSARQRMNISDLCLLFLKELATTPRLQDPWSSFQLARPVEDADSSSIPRLNMPFMSHFHVDDSVGTNLFHYFPKDMIENHAPRRLQATGEVVQRAGVAARAILKEKYNLDINVLTQTGNAEEDETRLAQCPTSLRPFFRGTFCLQHAKTSAPSREGEFWVCAQTGLVYCSALPPLGIMGTIVLKLERVIKSKAVYFSVNALVLSVLLGRSIRRGLASFLSKK